MSLDEWMLKSRQKGMVKSKKRHEVVESHDRPLPEAIQYAED